ncbi:prepilin-type N-terminal cleavage/methylation domain-containing protein [uncultured Halopseudomonas sp.]|uniref:prepilin-type N-terminal cleavage/methylation domain-containing protein n=1 Tax=uncultured Halopseudomonas sp. TaxID=2901193 RepID=UPI0030EB5774
MVHFKKLLKRKKGFTLAELLLAVAVVGILSAVAFPSYSKYVERMKITTAVTDIIDMGVKIERFRTANNGDLPASLAQLQGVPALDPWENPYQYLSFEGLNGQGQMRKDKNLVPVNTDYDLYSMGKDGRSVGPFTAKPSRDDVVRANDGGFVGLAADY